MLGDLKLTPAKGKAKEESRWNAEWWDFFSLTERPRRPIVWTNSSVIFTAHATQPLVTARLFPSSKQFVLPSPEPILTSPASYEPPAVISVSPHDDWLFAYFPGREIGGTGCLWKRGLQVDSWNIKDYWGFTRGGGAVTAAWLGTEREWVTDDIGFTTRLPHRGPLTPITSPTLLLVTEDHRLNLCYFRAYIPNLKVMKCSLTQLSIVQDNQPNTMHDVPGGPGGVRVCKSASIALGYNETSILIAMRSHLYPSHGASPRPPSSFNPMDLGIPLDLSQPSPPESDPSAEWESWGPEATIELCEVYLGFDGACINLAARPLPPIYHSSGPHLTELSFICTPPQASKSSALSSKNSQQSKRTSDIQDHLRGQIYLAVSFLDFGNFSSVPQSELILYKLTRSLSASSPNRTTWVANRQSTRTFAPGVLAFAIPCISPSSSPQSVSLYAGILDSVDVIPTRKTKTREIPIGSVVVLSLPDLSENDGWEKSIIMTPADGIERELPLNAAVSPNNVLLSTISSSLFATRTVVHALPVRRAKVSSSPSPDELRKGFSFSSALVSAIHSRRTTSDITHTLSLVPMDQLVDTLSATLSVFESKVHGDLSGIWTWEFLGITVEIYEAKARQARKNDDRNFFLARRDTAHDMCSMAACNTAFADCKEGNAYDLAAVWQLVGISQWAITFMEKLMKDCVLLSSTVALESSDESKMDVQADGEDLFGSAPSSPVFGLGVKKLDAPTLLHLGHPYALANLRSVLAHVKSFRQFLGGLSVRGENAQIARNILVDLVDCSGLNLSSLDSLLAECLRDAQSLATEDTKTSLAHCQPTPAMDTNLRQIIQKLTSTSAIDKSRLFVKSSDLVAGISGLSLVDRPSKENTRDVVSKGLLAQRGSTTTCLRCHGESEVGGGVTIAGHSSLRWKTWERAWMVRCICGGPWVLKNTFDQR